MQMKTPCHRIYVSQSSKEMSSIPLSNSFQKVLATLQQHLIQGKREKEVRLCFFVNPLIVTILYICGEILVRASCVRHTLLVYHCFHACSSSFFFLLSSFFRSLFSAASYKKLKEMKIVGISLSDRKKLRKTLRVTQRTLYTPRLALICG